MLGLTDGPPPETKDQAAEEGWIHLPAWGSLSAIGREKEDVVVRPGSALAGPLHDAGIEVDGKGYVKRLDDVFIPTLNQATCHAVQADLMNKGGSELVAKRGGRPKFHATHSSAALAANTFGPFLSSNESVPLGGQHFGGDVHLEVECPTGLAGTSPHTRLPR